MSKYKKLYDVLKCPHNVKIPINDLQAWKHPKNQPYKWIYNKLRLCEYQNIPCAPMPIQPKTYPIISKPIINLYGMGLNTVKIESEKDFMI